MEQQMIAVDVEPDENTSKMNPEKRISSKQFEVQYTIESEQKV
jgi:hypothetical protein